jgi:hypothetical protein
MMPVVAGVTVPGAGWMAPLVALFSAGSALALTTGFLGGSATAFRWAAWLGAPFLVMAGLLLLVAGRRVVTVDATTRTLARIGAPLLVTALCGGALAGLFGGLWPLSPAPLLALHMAWGLGGWLAALVTGVATTVLPMFWQTARLPSGVERWLPLAHWVPLLAYSAAVAVRPESPALPQWALLPWLLVAAVIAGIGLAGTVKAKRRHDPVWPLWPVACASMLAAAVLAAAVPFVSDSRAPLAWWIGTLALIGGGVLPVTAMLGKIVPFLVWLHLRKLLPPRARVPAMQAIIVPGRQRWQAVLLLAAYSSLLALPLAPAWLARAGGLAFAAANTWLAVQLLTALLCMRRMRTQGGLPPRAPRPATLPVEGGRHG